MRIKVSREFSLPWVSGDADPPAFTLPDAAPNRDRQEHYAVLRSQGLKSRELGYLRDSMLRYYREEHKKRGSKNVWTMHIEERVAKLCGGVPPVGFQSIRDELHALHDRVARSRRERAERRTPPDADHIFLPNEHMEAGGAARRVTKRVKAAFEDALWEALSLHDDDDVEVDLTHESPKMQSRFRADRRGDYLLSIRGTFRLDWYRLVHKERLEMPPDRGLNFIFDLREARPGYVRVAYLHRQTTDQRPVSRRLTLRYADLVKGED